MAAESRWNLGLWDTALWDGVAEIATAMHAVRRTERTTAKVATRTDIARADRTTAKVATRTDE